MKTLRKHSLRKLKMVVTILILIYGYGCASSKSPVIEHLKVNHKIAGDKIVFTLTNASQYPVLLSSLSSPYIEIHTEDDWQLIKVSPCPCGTPCAPQKPRRLLPGEQLSTNWNFLSRECRGRESLEKSFNSGQFRIKFTYRLLGDDSTTQSEKIWVEFQK